MPKGQGKFFTSLLIAASLLLSLGLAGCKKSASPADAEAQIRAAIQARLATNSNLNLQAFDTDIKQVTIDGDHAQAQVDFRIKNGPGAMQLTYRLEKQAGNWTVLDSNGDGSDPSHQAADPSQLPGATGAPGDASHSLADTLRSFKLGGAAGSSPSLPPGHPPITQTPGAPPQ